MTTEKGNANLTTVMKLINRDDYVAQLIRFVVFITCQKERAKWAVKKVHKSLLSNQNISWVTF